MVKAATWLFCAYLMLKLVQLVFGGRRDPTADPGFRAKLLRGEPWLFAVAFAVSVPLALGSGWYVRRGQERAFAHSADCYGRLRALDALPGIRGRFDPYKVFRTIEGAENAAALMGEALGLTPAAIDRTLAATMRAYADRYPALARRGDARAIEAEAAALNRCLTQPLMEI